MYSHLSQLRHYLQTLPFAVKLAYASLFIFAVILLSITAKRPEWLAYSTYFSKNISNPTTAQSIDKNVYDPWHSYYNRTTQQSSEESFTIQDSNFIDFKNELFERLIFTAEKPSECNYLTLPNNRDYIAISGERISVQFLDRWNLKRGTLRQITERQLVHTHRNIYGAQSFQEARYFKIVDGNCAFVRAPLITSARELPQNVEFNVRYHRDRDVLYVEFASRNYDNDQLVYEMPLEGRLNEPDSPDDVSNVQYAVSSNSSHQVSLGELKEDFTLNPLNSRHHPYFYTLDLHTARVDIHRLSVFNDHYVVGLYANPEKVYLLINKEDTKDNGLYGRFCMSAYGDRCHVTLVEYNLSNNLYKAIQTGLGMPKLSYYNSVNNELMISYSVSMAGSIAVEIWKDGIKTKDFTINTPIYVSEDEAPEIFEEYERQKKDFMVAYKDGKSRAHKQINAIPYDPGCWYNGSFCEVIFE